jgi:hypothetical protein
MAQQMGITGADLKTHPLLASQNACIEEVFTGSRKIRHRGIDTDKHTIRLWESETPDLWTVANNWHGQSRARKGENKGKGAVDFPDAWPILQTDVGVSYLRLLPLRMPLSSDQYIFDLDF